MTRQTTEPLSPIPTIRVVAGAILRDGRVLSAQRPIGTASPIAGMWELPGGKVDSGETDQQALARELMEELGVQVRVHSFLAEHSIQQATRNIHLVAYLCELPHGEPVALEHAELRWLGPDELLSVPWAAGDQTFLPFIQSQLRSLRG